MAILNVPAFDAIYANKEAALCNRALLRLASDVMKDDAEDTRNSRMCRTVYGATRDELLRMYPFAFAVKSVLIQEDTAYAFQMGEFTRAYKTLDTMAFTGTTALASAVITAVTGVELGQDMIGRVVAGPGIPVNARISAIDDTVGAQAITIDRPATAAATVSMTMSLAILKILSLAGNDETLFERVGAGSLDRVLTNVVTIHDDVLGNLVEMKYVENVIDPDKFDSQFVDALALRIASKICMTITSNRTLLADVQNEFAAMFQLAQVSTNQEKQLDESEELWTSGSGNVSSRK